ncbi:MULTISPECIES: methylenetetrahydrofolate reductase [Prauserella salsuginis group]|uniref:Methylenetetrahydrofolate reductase n=2 Tax=Prauserella salsuginis group TaxID=2893672 RepID=A0A839XRB6_9PSEU|nr:MULTISPECIES: methylenetetrahydrofolate reductase [Prauserella salsuginis group]MBB3662445.1 methylenetetrahydrofolate reductase (NADPH) [Prauserella sediminis]
MSARIPTSGGASSSTQPSARHRAALAGTLRNASYEVLPFRSTEDKVLAHVPLDVPLTVTATEAKGIETTVELAVRLSKNGYRIAPHLPARLIRDRAELDDIAAQLLESGIERIFAIGGDAAEPAGEFADAESLLIALAEGGHAFRNVGIAGYPEGHGKLSDAVIDEALRAKTGHAHEIITQLCFNPDTTIGWARGLHAEGIRTPIRVGVPGSINRQKLIRVSASLGLGQSARFLAKQSAMLWRFFLPNGYRPDKLITKLADQIGRPDNELAGIHVFTFNDLASTERWRQRWLDRLS